MGTLRVGKSHAHICYNPCMSLEDLMTLSLEETLQMSLGDVIRMSIDADMPICLTFKDQHGVSHAITAAVGQDAEALLEYMRATQNPSSLPPATERN